MAVDEASGHWMLPGFRVNGWQPRASALLLSRRHWAALESKHSGTRYLTWQLSCQKAAWHFLCTASMKGTKLQPLSAQMFLESSVSKELQLQFLIKPASLYTEITGVAKPERPKSRYSYVQQASSSLSLCKV